MKLKTSNNTKELTQTNKIKRHQWSAKISACTISLKYVADQVCGWQSNNCKLKKASLKRDCSKISEKWRNKNMKIKTTNLHNTIS